MRNISGLFRWDMNFTPQNVGLIKGKAKKKYYTVVVGYFTESDLSLFRGNPEYGYMFNFVTNGDGSSISVNETDIITNFSTNYS